MQIRALYHGSPSSSDAIQIAARLRREFGSLASPPIGAAMPTMTAKPTEGAKPHGTTPRITLVGAETGEIKAIGEPLRWYR